MNGIEEIPEDERVYLHNVEMLDPIASVVGCCYDAKKECWYTFKGNGFLLACLKGVKENQ